MIPGTGQRFRCNMISTITNRGRLSFMVFKKRFTSVVMIDFLRRLVLHSDRKVLLIVDGHPVHRSAKVRQWIDRHHRRIQLFLLPSYSPQLNPDEYLNQDVKTNALGRERPKDRAEMVGNIRSYLRSTQRQPAVVRLFFEAEEVAYAAA